MTGCSGAVAVFTPSSSIGGVESVALAAHAALSEGGGCSQLHAGIRGIARSPRPGGTWMALTWKTEALANARHPGVRRRGQLWLHGAELTRDSSRLHRHLRARVLEGADALLAVSPLAVQLVPEDLRHRVQLMGPPVPAADRAADRGTPRDDRARATGRLRLLSVGRALPRKGHDLAIEVARVLSVSAPVELDVVGPGPDVPRLEQLAADAARPGLTVRVHGAVPEAVKDRLYTSADVLLFLPRSEDGEFEGLGLVVLEAAARGCPAVVLDCGGSRFGVCEGRTGRVLPAQAQPRQIADAVTALVVDEQARAAAALFARHFELAAWRRRVRAAAAGEWPAWTWPSLV
jgi:glycosyltransferase involved in cell wall biosynthesis